jgi:type IV pilus assembly protein PilM
VFETLWRRLNRWGSAAVEINDRCLALWAPGADAPVMAPLPLGLVQNGIPKTTAAIGDLLGDLVLQAGLNLRAAAAVLPSGETEWRRLRLAPDGVLQPQQLPLGEIDSNLTLLPLGEPGEWMALLNQRQTIDRWIEVFAIADLELDFLEVAELAQMRALGLEFANPHTPDCMLLDLQLGGSFFTLIQQGLPAYRHRLSPVGVSETETANFLSQLEQLLAYLDRQQLGDLPVWLLGCQLLELDLAKKLVAISNNRLQLMPLNGIGSGDPLTDATFAGLIGTVQRITDG